MSILRSLTSFFVQVLAVVFVLIGLAALEHSLHPKTLSEHTVVEIQGGIICLLVLWFGLRQTRFVQYLSVPFLAVIYWLRDIWETLSYFVIATGLIYIAGYLEGFHTEHYWTSSLWLVSVLGCGALAILAWISGIVKVDLARQEK